MSSHDSKPVRRYELLRYVLGELDGVERRSLEARLARDPDARARLEALQSEHASYLEGVDLGVESARILERLEAASAAPGRARALGFGLAATCAGLLFVAPLAYRNLLESPDPSTRIKGSPVAIEMYVKAGEEIRRATDGVQLHPGDQIQFRYRAGGYGYLIVVSVDGRQVVSPLYPADQGESIVVEPSGSHVLDGSIILDEALGPERVFAVFSEESVSFEEVRRAIDRVASDGVSVEHVETLPLGRDDVAQATVLFLKRQP